MEKIITDYLIKNLAPRLTNRFNLNLNEVEQEIRLFCSSSPGKRQQQQDQQQQDQQQQDQQQQDQQLSLISKFNKLTIPQLKELATVKHIKIPNKVKKNEIIQMLICKNVLVDKNNHLQISAPRESVKKEVVKNFAGQIFTSKSGEQWKIGNMIGSGGFGVIYDIVNQISSSNRENYVIKLERNKPGIGLYFETSVYRKLKSDGVLRMIDSGKLTHSTLPLLDKNEEYYYLILPKFETTLSEKIKQGMTLLEKNDTINDILNRLKYINSKGYIHLDIKPDNIMYLKNEWYLIDFGISYNYVDKEVLNKKQAGNGTPIYMSRDMHIGLVSRKADLESLIYVLLKMNNIQFPWIRQQEKKEKKETFMNWVLEQKDNFMETYKDLPIPQSHKNFIEKVNALKIKNNPNYDDLKIKT